MTILTQYKNKLSTLTKLDRVFKIYVPSTMDVDKQINSDSYIDDTLTFMSGMFGGATMSKVFGAWMSNSGEVIKEDVTIVYSNTDSSDFDNKINEVISHAEYLKFAMGQEAISIEIDGTLYFV